MSLGKTGNVRKHNKVRKSNRETTNGEQKELTRSLAFSGSNPNSFGTALLNFNYDILNVDGLATQCPHLLGKASDQLVHALDIQKPECYFEAKIGSYRFLGPRRMDRTGAFQLIVVDAKAQDDVEHQVAVSEASAEAMKAISKAIASERTLAAMCSSALQALAFYLPFSAAAIWVIDPESKVLELTSSVGISRQGVTALSKLSIKGPPTTAAELVAFTGRPLKIDDVASATLTADLDAKVCYLQPGEARILPLTKSGQLLGVLEIIGRANEPMFARLDSLYDAVSEQIALAIGSTQMVEEFERLASHDALTGLANHRHLHEVLNQRVSEAERNSQSLGVVMIDVDHFRAFNEEEGHELGDQVLRLVAGVLKGCLRPYDLAARYGGEEFSAIMPGITPEIALAVAERMRKTIESTPCVSTQGILRNVTASFGVAIFPQAGLNAKALLKAADTALYESKKAGRNRVTLYSEVSTETQTKLSVELHRALNWLSPEALERGQSLARRVADQASLLAKAFRLTEGQCAILESLLIIAPEVVSRMEQGDFVIADLEAVDGFRVLMPNLISLNEHFDGSGPLGKSAHNIPVLTRVLQVLLAFDRGDIANTPQGFLDPQAVACLNGPGLAA